MKPDVGVVGGGPAGLAAALSVARSGLRVALLAPPPAQKDNRTAALFTGSVRLLQNLGVWETCRAAWEPLRAIRIVDDTGSLLRAPEVLFSASEVGLETFGFNVPNVSLIEALRAQAAEAATLTVMETAGVRELDIGANHVSLKLAEGHQVSVRLVIGADGRNSLSRQAAGIAARTWAYEQSALTCTFTHQRPHDGVSTEFHRTGGPLTVVPAPGRSSNLVWVERPAVARRLGDLDETTFRDALETALQGLLGPIEEVSARRLFPLSGLKAHAAGQNRVALVGESAHVMPPIGAQGLNLGLRDAAILADCIGDALKEGRDIGGSETLTAYTRARSFDITTRAWSIDVLNRSLTSELLPVQLIRGLGLHALKAIGPLRRLAIREGLAPSFVTPRLMRSEGDTTAHTS
ncbi:MAG: UbiH/UbiF family hydroxylase [Hyphomicrobium sp.]